MSHPSARPSTQRVGSSNKYSASFSAPWATVRVMRAQFILASTLGEQLFAVFRGERSGNVLSIAHRVGNGNSVALSKLVQGGRAVVSLNLRSRLDMERHFLVLVGFDRHVLGLEVNADDASGHCLITVGSIGGFFL